MYVVHSQYSSWGYDIGGDPIITYEKYEDANLCCHLLNLKAQCLSYSLDDLDDYKELATFEGIEFNEDATEETLREALEKYYGDKGLMHHSDACSVTYYIQGVESVFNSFEKKVFDTLYIRFDGE